MAVMTSNLWLGQADARAVLRVAREHDVDVLSLQEMRPRQMRRFATDHSPSGSWSRSAAPAAAG